jgi:N-dimethylarginine dimethylaminohydrolase
MGMKTVEVLPEVPGGEQEFWEGQGDVAWFRGTALLFHGGRTTLRGAEAAAAWFPNHLLVEIREPAFHGNMAALPLSAVDRLLVCPEVIALRSMHQLSARFGDALEEVTEEEIRSYATNGLPMGRELLAPHTLPPRVKARIESLGMRVVLLAMEELCVKAGGASRCLVSAATVDQRLLTIPAEMDYRQLRPQLISD